MPEPRDYIRDGAEIYRRSFAIIRAEADLGRFDAVDLVVGASRSAEAYDSPSQFRNDAIRFGASAVHPDHIPFFTHASASFTKYSPPCFFPRGSSYTPA